MVTTYTYTAKISCWKKHECVACGCVYRYLFRRKVRGTGGTERAARGSAEGKVVRTLTDDVDVRPCPSCGLVQPDMIGRAKAARHGRIAWVSLALLTTLIILGGFQVIPGDGPALACAAVAAGAALLHLAVVISNPNRDRDKNRAVASAARGQGTLEVIAPGRTGELPPPVPTAGLAHGIGIAAGVVAAAVMFAPVVNRELHGLPLNPGMVPEVVSPGDGVKVYFPDEIDCVAGKWFGSPRVTVLNATEFPGRPPAVSASAAEATWSESMSVNTRELHTRPKLWARLVPADERLAGRTLKVRVDMLVRYPHAEGSNNFADRQQALANTYEIRLAPVGAGLTYSSVWWGGLVFGSLTSFSAGLFLRSLANELRKHARPTEVQRYGTSGNADPAPAV